MAENDSGGGRARGMSGGAIATLVGAAVLVVFMIQNTEQIRVKFLTWSFSWPVWLLIIVSAVFGALVWLGLGVLRRHRRRRARRAGRD
jgi:uncharacterized integral membrane protein